MQISLSRDMSKIGAVKGRQIFALFSLCALIGCTDVDSFPVFDGPGPGADAIDAIAGSYTGTIGDDSAQLIIEPFSDQSDVDHSNTLKWRLQLATGEVFESRAVVSVIPDSKTYLVTLSGQHTTAYNAKTRDSGFDSKNKNAIALVQFEQPKLLFWPPGAYNKLFKEVVEEISNPDLEARYILDFLIQNHDSIVANQSLLTFTRISVEDEENKKPELIRNLDSYYYVTKYGIENFKYSDSDDGIPFYKNYTENGQLWGGAYWYKDTQQAFWVPAGAKHQCNRSGWLPGNWGAIFKKVGEGVWEQTSRYPNSRRYDPNVCKRWDYVTNPCEKHHCVERYGQKKLYPAYLVDSYEKAKRISQRLK